MIDLNLKTQEEIDKGKIKWGKTLPFALLVLILIILIYMGLSIYTIKINEKTNLTRDIYNQKLEDIKSGNAKNVFDFQNRLNESKKIVEGNINPSDSLKEIEKVMIPGVYLFSFQFDAENRKISLESVAFNYNDVSKQILSFKKSAYFSDVSAGETNVSPEGGKINFKVDLKIK